MLTSVRIDDFRSCRGVVLDNLRPVTMLVGRNAVGKTNILRAIRWLASAATSVSPFETGVGSKHVSFHIVLERTIYHYSFRSRFTFTLQQEQPFESLLIESLSCEDTEGAEHVVFERQNEVVKLPQPETPIKIGGSTPCMPALVSILSADSSTVRAIRPFLSVLEGIRYYPLDESNASDSAPITQSTYEEWLTRYRGTGDPGTSVLHRMLHMKLTDDARLQELRSLLGRDGLGVLDSFEVVYLGTPRSESQPHGGKWYWIPFRPSLQGRESAGSLSFQDLSSGTQRVIRIVVSLLFDRPSVMLLEHPEDGIHPGLLRKLIDLLRNYSDQSQLIVSSHSPAVFNMLEPEAVRLVTMEEGATLVRPLTPEELRVAGRFLEEDGSLSDFLETVGEE